MQVLYLCRAPRTKETLPNFMKWRRITKHPLVFRGLTGSQRTPGNGASHKPWRREEERKEEEEEEEEEEEGEKEGEEFRVCFWYEF